MQCINCNHLKRKEDCTCYCRITGKITLSWDSADDCENFEELIGGKL